MALNLSANDRLEVRFHCQDVEQGSINTVFFRVVAVTGAVTDKDAAVHFDGDIGTELPNFINTEARYLGCTVRIANRLPLPIVQTSTASAGDGLASGNPLPRQSAGLISFRTALAGPGGRGRWFMPFPAASSNDGGGKPSAGYKGSLATFGVALLATISIPALVGGGSADVAFVLWSRKNAAMRAIEDIQASPLWATQRKRGGFGKPNTSPF